METINIHNYELFFLDYIEGNLSKSQIDDLNKFLAEHPELKDELNGFEDIKLLPEHIEYKHKDKLIKQTQSQLFDITNFEYLAVAELEKDITKEEKDELNSLIKKDEELKNSLHIFKNTKLKANNNITFNKKDKLIKSIIPIYIKRSSYAVAAILIMFFILNQGIFIEKENNTVQLASIKNTTVQKSIKENTIKKKQEKLNTENKKQRFSISHNQTNKLTNNKIFAFDDNESQKNVDIYKELNVTIPDLKTETLIFEKNNTDLQPTFTDLAYYKPKTNNEKSKLWEYAETGVKIWKMVSSSDLEMNNKYKEDGKIEKFNVYASNFKFSKTFKR
ncbi:MAG: hypothetical protein GXO49_01925 [Chlorobi bacterium]|nr:hypothetical protein [Chlorobiota bacterium]